MAYKHIKYDIPSSILKIQTNNYTELFNLCFSYQDEPNDQIKQVFLHPITKEYVPITQQNHKLT